MTDARFRRLVGIDDKGWKLEAVQWDSADSDMTRAYPKWFIDLLTGTHSKGFEIKFHSTMRVWFLRSPTGPDYQLEEGVWVCQNLYGECFMTRDSGMELVYRLHDEEHDGPW